MLDAVQCNSEADEVTQMPILILPFDAPTYAPERVGASEDAVDADGDIDLGNGFRSSRGNITTPGETITDDPQWMRYSPQGSCHATLN